jgi:hypothetical protein
VGLSFCFVFDCFDDTPAVNLVQVEGLDLTRRIAVPSLITARSTDVRFRRQSRHRAGHRPMSAYDPKRTLPFQSVALPESIHLGTMRLAA